MPGRVIPSEDGYTIRGIAPPSLARQSSEVRLMFWGWVLEAGLKQKDRDLSQGLDKDGNLMRISPKTREHRHSAMTPSGKGDPRAPALEPGRKLSRVRSLLTGRAETDRAEFWWKFDPHIGDSFARILEHQRDEGRDVFGLSPAALKRVMAQSWEKYRRWEQGKPVAMPAPIGVAQAQPIVMAGHAASPLATFGIGRAGAPTGQWSGGMRAEEWVRHFRQPAAATIPQRPKGPYSRLLSHIWGDRREPRRMTQRQVLPDLVKTLSLPAPSPKFGLPAPNPIKVKPPTYSPAANPTPTPTVRPKKTKGASDVIFVRAPAGGATSDVTGRFYKGGQLMPIHGLSAGQAKSAAKRKGVGSTPPKANEGGKQRPPREPRPPKTAEQIAAEGAELAAWNEAKNSPLGDIFGMGERPHPVDRSPRLDKFMEWVEATLGVHLNPTIAAAEEVFIRNTIAETTASQRQGMSDAELRAILLENLRLHYESEAAYLKAKFVKRHPNAPAAISAIRSAVGTRSIEAKAFDLAEIGRSMGSKPK